MTKKELSNYIINERQMVVSDIMRLAGYNVNYLNCRPEEAVPSTSLHRIQSAIEFMQAHMDAVCAFMKQKEEERMEERRRRCYDRMIGVIRRTIKFSEIHGFYNEYKYGLDDNLVDNSWQKKLTTTD